MVLTIGLFFFFRATVETPKDQIVEVETSPVQQFVTSCIDSLTTEAVNTIGENGGYVKISESIRANPNSYLSYFGFGDAILPFWWYQGVSAIPPLDSMTTQISDYVESNLKICVGNFAPLRNQFTIEEKGRPEAIASINENDITVSVKYPLQVISLSNNSLQEIEEFHADLPIRLKKVYQLAKEIMDAENSNKFLEKRTMDLIVLDQSIPDTDIEVTCDKREWYLPQIKERLKKLVSTNFQYIKIANAKTTDNTYVESPEGTGYNQSYFNYHYVWNVSEKNYPDMHATVSYLQNWPFYLYARPSHNGILRSNSEDGFDMLEGLCLHIWHFTYDAVYPVVVSLYDEQTPQHREFHFNFATDVSIKSNTPLRENFASSIFEFSDNTVQDEYCQSPRNEVTVYTQDAVTKEPVPNVNLSLICGGFNCPLGPSQILGFGAAAGVIEKMPFCVSAFVKGSATGYAASQLNIQTSLKDRAYTLDLTPVKKFATISIKKHQESHPAESVALDNELAYIHIEGPDYAQDLVYPFIEGKTFDLLAKTDFTYNITIYIVTNESVLGGYQAQWKPSWDSMKNANSITFHVILSDAKEETEKYKFITHLSEQSKKIPEPEFT